MHNAGDRKDATARSDELAAALAELAELRARLIDEASNRHGTGWSVCGAALRWHGLIVYRDTHSMPSEAMEKTTEAADELFGLVVQASALDLADLALKLAVLQISMRDDHSTYTKQLNEADLLASALADAVVLAAIAPVGGAA